jgi:hypothetical protein
MQWMHSYSELVLQQSADTNCQCKLQSLSSSVMHQLKRWIQLTDDLSVVGSTAVSAWASW